MTGLFFWGKKLRLIVISDESGCLGTTYSGATRNYIISMACFPGEESMKKFIEIARSCSRKYLKSRLRKWSELKKVAKDDPCALEGFVTELLSGNNRDYICLLGFYILNKSEVECGQKLTDKAIIAGHAQNGYLYGFKRIFPFVKKLNFHQPGSYLFNNPKVDWFIDINDRKYQDKIKVQIHDLAREKKVILGGPYFIPKKSEKYSDEARAIKIIDIIGGIVSKSFDEYTANNTCTAKDCFQSSLCINPYKNLWEKILNTTMNIDIIFNDQKIWKWDGIIYAPYCNRKKHERFLKKDGYFV